MGKWENAGNQHFLFFPQNDFFLTYKIFVIINI